MKSFIFVVVAGLFAAVTAHPSWTDLKGTFLVYTSLPRTIRDPLFTEQNWTAANPNDCTNDGKFNGIQYLSNDEHSVSLLFDINGVIAGIQMMFPHSEALSINNTLRYDRVGIYNNATYNNETYFVLTAYFVNASTICTSGRGDGDLPVDGTGTGVWIQTGPGPNSTLEIPFARPEGDEAVRSKWAENRCLNAMGFHNFYRQSEYNSTNCTQMDPIFGLYSSGSQKELLGFGFITPGNFTSSRFEYPTPEAMIAILGPENTPQCILDTHARMRVTSFHVFFGAAPQTINCSAKANISGY